MKGDKRNYPIPLISLIFVVAVLVLFVNLAFATTPTKPNHAEASSTSDAVANAIGGPQIVNAGDMIGGDTTVTTGSSRAYAFAHGLGDVDINDCLASTQWGTIIVSRQKVVLNKWCAAEVYDAKGLFHMAALMRCDISEVAEHFQTANACIEANTVSVQPTVTEVVISPDFDEHEDEEERHEYEIARLQSQYEALQQAIAETAEKDRQGRIAAQRAAEAHRQAELERQAYWAARLAEKEQ